MNMLPMILLMLTCAQVEAADIDRAPSGAIVTIRPAETEDVTIFDAQHTPVILPDDTPRPIWLVNPESWKMASAEVQRLSVYPDIVTHHEATIDKLQGELIESHERYVDEHDARVTAQEQVTGLKKQRWRWAGVGTAAGIVITIAGTFAVASVL